MTAPRCPECNRERIKLSSGAGYVCPSGHGAIVQAGPPAQGQLTLGHDGVLPFEEE